MPDNLNLDTGERRINEAVCIDTKRIFDSCVSKDCLEDLRVTFFSRSQRLIDEAVTVKTRDCCIEEVSIDVEEVPFNRGFYSVDITFYFKLCFDTYSAPCTTPQVAVGFAKFNKKCILFGSNGDVKVFVSNSASETTDCPVAPNIQTLLQRFRQLTLLYFQPIFAIAVIATFLYALCSRSLFLILWRIQFRPAVHLKQYL